MSFQYKSRSFLLVGCLCIGSITRCLAQNTPELSQPGPTGTATVTSDLPAVIVPNGKLNYQRGYMPRLPITNAAAVTASSPDVLTSTIYKDGFSRQMQIIKKDFVQQGQHLVTPIDTRFQTEDYSFLPFSVSGASTFRPDALVEQRSFYLNRYPAESGASYSRARRYSDAIERYTQTFTAGKSQVGQGRATTVRQVTNEANEVMIWKINASGAPVSSSYYPAGELFGERTTSSAGAETLVYKDKEGRLIYQKTYQTDVVSQGSALAIYGVTYYIYDELVHLRFVVPPKASSLISSGTLSQAVLSNLCFQYRYDNRGLKIEQQFPGKGTEFFVYDKRKRLVFYQDGNLRNENNKWACSIYDALDRPLITGKYEGAEDRATLQAYFDNSTTYGANSILYYQKNYDLWATYPTGMLGVEVLTQTYYDNYSFIDPSSALWNTYSSELQFTETLTLPGAETPVRSKLTEGKVTGTRVKILPSPNASPSVTGEWRETLNYFDDKGRMIYTVSRDLYQGNPVHIHYNGSQYDFSDNLLISKHVMVNALTTDNSYRHSELTRNIYDNLTGRLTQTKHKVNTGPWNITAMYSYDELGRSKRKVLGNFGEVQDYDYNIRGQVTGINSIYAETGNRQGESRSFGVSLKYDYGFSQPKYDGKLAGIVWRGAGQSLAMAYGYSYDREGRLTAADYRRYEPPSGSYLTHAWRNDFSDYSVSNLSYDRNGNIESMKQRGINLSGQPDDIDRLRYEYESQSNKLSKVADTVTTDFGRGDFQDGNPGGVDYNYDPNGNVTNDKNKNISAISYTHFNKPRRIAYNNGNYIEYSYDAMGNKVQELAYTLAQNKTDTTDYLGNFVYKNNGLQYASTPEGRTVYNKASQTFKEEFFVKDHLGNVRSVIDVYTYPTQQYLATYEVASANLENLFFEKVDEVRDDKPGSTWNGDLKSARLNGADPSRVTGTSALLKVMAGDKVEMSVNNFYENYAADEDQPLQAEAILASVISTLTGGGGGMPGESHDTKMVDRTFTQDNYNAFDQLVQANTDIMRPRANLNYILFDESMRIVESSSGNFQANGNGTWTQIGTTTPLVMPVNGYLAVYLTNGSKNAGCLTCTDVFFDQLVLRFTRGSLREEAHYYPHGLPIAGIGGEADAFKENRKKYQSNEFIKDFGLNWMDFQARQYDPQLGRFMGIDPLADQQGQQVWSVYAAMGNNPAMMIDPSGTTFTVSGDMAMAKQMLNEWLGKDNYSLDGGVVTLKVGKEYDAFKNLLDYFTKFGIAGSGGSAAAAAAWVISMIGDQTRNVNAKVQNNGRIALEATSESGVLDNHFNSYDIDTYNGIEAGMNNKLSNPTYDFLKNSRYAIKSGLYIPQGALLFATKTAWGRNLAGVGSKLTLSEYRLTKAFGGSLTRIGWGLGTVNAYLLYHQYDKGEIGALQFWSEEVSNGLTQVPMLGWAWGVGWEVGRYTTSSDWYKQYCRPAIWGGLDWIFNRNTPLD